MARTTLFEEQTVEGFSPDSEFDGAYSTNAIGTAEFVPGEEYVIVWDGESFSCVAQDVSAMLPGAVVVGDMSGFELAGNGEPFIIMSMVADGGILYGFLAVDGSTATSHTVGIYQGDDEEEATPDYDPNDVTIKRYSGEGKVYENVPFIYLTHASGEGKVPFTYGRAVENVPIALDLADGDQIIIADDGILVKSAIIAKPADLSPENVRYGKEIAGVTGEFLGDTEEVTVDLAMADGDQVIEPSAEGKAFSKVTITKPADLSPENVRSGKSIGGVDGEFIGDTEELTLDLDMATGDQVILPTADGKVISQVTVTKPADLVPGNIAEGKVIGGVVGTFVGGGGGNASKIDAPYVLYKVATAYRLWYSSSKTYTLSVSASLPISARIMNVLTNGSQYSNSTSSYVNGYPALSALGNNPYTITESGNNKTIKYDYATYLSARYYYNLIAIMLISFSVPGITIEATENGIVFECDSTVTALPVASIPKLNEIITADLSKSVITTLPDTAFLKAVTLQNVYLPDTLKTIGAQAFQGCTALAQLTIPENVSTIGAQAFMSCAELAEIALPEGVISVGANAFNACAKLTSIALSESLTTIGGSAFYSCTSLPEITLPDSVTTMGSYAFSYCYALKNVVLSKNLTSLPDRTFNACTALTEIDITNGIPTIGNYVFSGCTALTRVSIPASVTSMGTYVFQNLTALTDVTVAEGATSIGTYTFYGCTKLANVSLSNSITAIGNNVFYNCNSLETINIPSALTTIGTYAFYQCRKMPSICLPDSVTTIGAQAFYMCSGLTEINIPGGVITINSSTFAGCSALNNVTLNEGLTTISSNAFQSCTSLTEIIIPSTVATIAGYVFYDCTALETVDFSNHTSVPTLSGTNAFYNCSSALQIKVPAALYDTWIAATNWSTYASYIVAV